MSETHRSTGDYDAPIQYEIRISGHLAARWAGRFGGMTITLEEGGDTRLTGSVVDQAALHGLLRKVRDSGMALLSVNQLSSKNSQSNKRRFPMNNLQKSGGIAALIHAAAYAAAILWFIVLLSPLLNADPRQHMAFVADNQASMYAAILISYWLTGGTLVVIALALYERLQNGSAALMQIATIFGCIWAALIIGSGNLMLSDFGVVAKLYGNNPVQAETVWLALDAVETGIVSGNEIVGSLWVLLLSVAAMRTNGLPLGLNVLGMALGVVGIVTGILAFIPAVKEIIMLFGLGMIVWSAWVGIAMLRNRPGATA